MTESTRAEIEAQKRRLDQLRLERSNRHSNRGSSISNSSIHAGEPSLNLPHVQSVEEIPSDAPPVVLTTPSPAQRLTAAALEQSNDFRPKRKESSLGNTPSFPVSLSTVGAVNGLPKSEDGGEAPHIEQPASPTGIRRRALGFIEQAQRLRDETGNDAFSSAPADLRTGFHFEEMETDQRTEIRDEEWASFAFIACLAVESRCEAEAAQTRRRAAEKQAASALSGNDTPHEELTLDQALNLLQRTSDRFRAREVELEENQTKMQAEVQEMRNERNRLRSTVDDLRNRLDAYRERTILRDEPPSTKKSETEAQSIHKITEELRRENHRLLTELQQSQRELRTANDALFNEERDKQAALASVIAACKEGEEIALAKVIQERDRRVDEADRVLTKERTAHERTRERCRQLEELYENALESRRVAERDVNHSVATMRELEVRATKRIAASRRKAERDQQPLKRQITELSVALAQKSSVAEHLKDELTVLETMLKDDPAAARGQQPLDYSCSSVGHGLVNTPASFLFTQRAKVSPMMPQMDNETIDIENMLNVDVVQHPRELQ